MGSGEQEEEWARALEDVMQGVDCVLIAVE